MKWLVKLVRKIEFIRWLVKNEHSLSHKGIGIYSSFFFYKTINLQTLIKELSEKIVREKGQGIVNSSFTSIKQEVRE